MNNSASDSLILIPFLGLEFLFSAHSHCVCVWETLFAGAPNYYSWTLSFRWSAPAQSHFLIFCAAPESAAAFYIICESKKTGRGPLLLAASQSFRQRAWLKIVLARTNSWVYRQPLVSHKFLGNILFRRRCKRCLWRLHTGSGLRVGARRSAGSRRNATQSKSVTNLASKNIMMAIFL